ncbi:bifunctional DNA primase/polymerase [Rhodococcus cerastii]|uniref:Bifunctional DNA primase/polymerase n=1 Tax=Rhodococcus cerastii TaxID=908616 RepID=A0ABU4CYY7_9NOCA|nr:bifunctional DNA primase/polymerase [Rhodococcus cerastii]MDV6302673.1 bifunctional DNA primase/polymerase [Rhodococcus cerastii]
MSGFGDYAHQYKAAGWNVVPVPHASKRITVTGFTGHDGIDASGADLQAWIDGGHEGDNIGLRMPENVVGIDIDAYHDGLTTLAALVQDLGPLPATPRTTARADGSGISFYRVPNSTLLPSGLGKGIDIVRRGHRYALAPPSLHPEGHPYRWLDTEDTEVDFLTVDSLPTLPESWVSHLDGLGTAPAAITAPDAEPVRLTDGSADTEVARALADAIEAAQGESGQRHDTALEHINRIVRLAERGHSGTADAVASLKAAYVLAIGSDRSDAAAEFDRMVHGARVKVGQTPSAEHNTVQGRTAVDEMIGALRSQSVEPEPVALVGSSWAPVDLASVLDGEFVPVVPTMLTRSDGVSLIYPGLTHSFHGEPESGKSLVLQSETVTRIMAGERVLYLDFESSQDQVINRLREFGASDAAILANLTYVRPFEPFNAQSPHWTALLGTRYTLAVLDGVTEAMSLSGRELIDNGSVAHFLRELPDAIARATGAAVAMIDHVVKSKDGRGRGAIGGQHKLAGLSGASYTVEPISPIMPGKRGELSIRIGKDREGQVRPHCGKWTSTDRTQEAARVIVDSTGTSPVVIVNPPGDVADGTTTRNLPESEVIRRLVSNLLANKPQGVLSSTIAGRIKKSAPKTRTELDWLTEEGYLREERAPHNGRKFFQVHPYGDDPE